MWLFNLIYKVRNSWYWLYTYQWMTTERSVMVSYMTQIYEWHGSNRQERAASSIAYISLFYYLFIWFFVIVMLHQDLIIDQWCSVRSVRVCNKMFVRLCLSVTCRKYSWKSANLNGRQRFELNAPLLCGAEDERGTCVITLFHCYTSHRLASDLSTQIGPWVCVCLTLGQQHHDNR